MQSTNTHQQGIAAAERLTPLASGLESTSKCKLSALDHCMSLTHDALHISQPTSLYLGGGGVILVARLKVLGFSGHVEAHAHQGIFPISPCVVQGEVKGHLIPPLLHLHAQPLVRYLRCFSIGSYSYLTRVLGLHHRAAM